MPGGFFLNLLGWKSHGAFDERFVMHRFKSTRLAAAAGLVLAFAIFTWEAVKKSVLRWDLFAIIVVMAVVKVIAMMYYQRTH